MKTRECVWCEFVLDCKGKPTNKPCVNYKPDKDKPKDERNEDNGNK